MELTKDHNQAKNLVLSMCQPIQEIVQPLFSLLNIQGFSFHRVYKNEERIFFANSPQWVENYFEKDYLLIHSYQKFLNIPPYLLWAQWPKEDKILQQLIQDAYANFNTGNALTTTRVYKDYIDTFALRGFAWDTDVNHRYMTYLMSINKFMDFFLIEARDLILRAEKQRITLDKDSPIVINWTPNFPSNHKLQVNHGLLSNTDLLHPDTGKPFLTPRESECIEQLLKGKTAKEIAREMNISFRTVEEYLTNAKIKINTTSRSGILSRLLAVDYNKHILMRTFE